MNSQFGGTAAIGVAGMALVAVVAFLSHSKRRVSFSTACQTGACDSIFKRSALDHLVAKMLVPEVDGLNRLLVNDHGYLMLNGVRDRI